MRRPPDEARAHARPTARGTKAATALLCAIGLVASLLALAVAPASAETTTVVVDETAMGATWFTGDTRPGGTLEWDDTYAGALGEEAAILETDATNAAKVQLLTDAYDGVALSDIEEMRYATHKDGLSTGGAPTLPALNLRIDSDDDGDVDAYLVYEPYQDQGNAAVQTDVWQTWDTIANGTAEWWSGQLAACPQATPCTWDEILGLFPDAVVLEDTDAFVGPGQTEHLGSLGFNLGSFNQGITAGVDALAITVGGQETVYDFELQPVTSTVVQVDASDLGETWHSGDTRNDGALAFAATYGGVDSDSAATFETPASADKVQLLTDELDGVALADVDEISYSAYRDSASTGFIAGLPALNLRIDSDDDGEVDAYLVFEPYQDQGNAAVQSDTWQAWDAMRNGDAQWWSGQLAACPQATPCEWDEIVALFPEAVILEDTDAFVGPGQTEHLGSFGVNLGSGNPGLVGAADRVAITVGPEETVYDLELFAAPSAPTDLAGTADVCVADTEGVPLNAGGPVVTVTWAAPAEENGSAITGYTVHRDGAEIATVDGATTTYVDLDADPETDHTYEVTATNGAGEGAPAEVEVSTPALPPAFGDVSPGHPFFTEICTIAASAVTTGFPDGGFKPAAPVSRQAMAAFLYRLAGADEEAPTTATFPDVPPGSQFFTEIEWLNAEGITTGYDDGTFRPSATVTRQAMAAFMYRYAGSTFEGTEQSFSDVSDANRFYDEIEWMADAGISNGYEDGTYRPSALVTRQAMAAFLDRLSNLT